MIDYRAVMDKIKTSAQSWYAERILAINPKRSPLRPIGSVLPKERPPTIVPVKNKSITITWKISKSGNEYFNFGNYNVVIYKAKSEGVYKYMYVDTKTQKPTFFQQGFINLSDCRRESIRNSIIKKYPDITNVKSIPAQRVQ